MIVLYHPLIIALLGTSKWSEHIVRLLIYWSAMINFFRSEKSPFYDTTSSRSLHPPGCSKTFRLTENNLFSYQLGLLRKLSTVFWPCWCLETSPHPLSLYLYYIILGVELNRQDFF